MTSGQTAGHIVRSSYQYDERENNLHEAHHIVNMACGSILPHQYDER